MPKKHKTPKLSQDAIFFLSKLFPWAGPDCKERVTCVDLKGKVLGPRAIEASCEAMEAGYIDINIEEQVYTRLKVFLGPVLKLQRIREAYEAFDLFVEPEMPKVSEHVPFDFVPLIQTMMALSRIQTDVLCALEYKDLSDPVARLHVQHAIQAMQRLATEGVRDLETVLESGN